MIGIAGRHLGAENLKTAIPERVSGVRIPLPPPSTLLLRLDFREHGRQNFNSSVRLLRVCCMTGWLAASGWLSLRHQRQCSLLNDLHRMACASGTSLTQGTVVVATFECRSKPLAARASFVSAVARVPIPAAAAFDAMALKRTKIVSMGGAPTTICPFSNHSSTPDFLGQNFSSCHAFRPNACAMRARFLRQASIFPVSTSAK